MGGAYGHINHPYENLDLTFGDLKKIIQKALCAKLKNAKEKMDGINCFVSFIDNKIVYSRNKGNLINNGISSTELVELFDKNKIEKLTRSIKLFTDEIELIFKNTPKICNIFCNGKYWLNVEILNTNNINVIDYENNYIVIHDILKVENGKLICTNNNKKRQCMKSIKSYQPIYEYYKPIDIDRKIKLNKITDNSFLLRLNNEMQNYDLTNKNTIKDYWDRKVDWYVNRYKVTPDTIFLDMSKSEIKKFILYPLYKLFIDLGDIVISNATNYLSTDSKHDFTGRIVNKIDKLNPEINPDLLSEKLKEKFNTYKHELISSNIFNNNPYFNPTEGIVFEYKNKKYKLTGLFSIINQILGINRYAR